MNQPNPTERTRSPIIYAHFGNTFYLNTVLEQALRSCPDRGIVLLGDKTNAWLSEIGIVHYDVTKWHHSHLLHELNRVFRLVGGDIWLEKVNQAKTLISGTCVSWTWFNFAKWIYLYCFMLEAEAESIWFFDSDVLILGELESLEQDAVSKSMAWTYWNNLHQQQGWIGTRDLVRDFITHFIAIFEDNERLLELENTVFKHNPHWGFTLMRAWDDFFATRVSSQSSHINSLGVLSPLVSVSYSTNAAGLFRKSPRKLDGLDVVDLYIGEMGKIYVYDLKTFAYVPVAMLDTSWISPHSFALIVESTRQKHAFCVRCLRPIDSMWSISLYVTAKRIKDSIASRLSSLLLSK